MRIIFFGSPEFALPSLKLLTLRHDVAMVVTQPDKPKGRGRKLSATPVKEYCVEKNIPYISPKAVKTGSFAEKLKAVRADYGVVVAYGRILTEQVLEIPRFGCINLHPSLLPMYRGPAPVNHTLIQGDTISGVTVMQMNKNMDEGDIIVQQKYNISDFKSAGDLLGFFSDKGARLLCDVIDKEESLKKLMDRVPQDHSGATYAPMLNTDTAHIDWRQKADKVSGLIKGLDPRPGAWTMYNGFRIKLFHSEPREFSCQAGEIIGFDGEGLLVGCGEGSVCINEVQLPGKTRMSFKAAISGNQFTVGTFMEV
ncbi:MAG: methionyl-tRNA formyltransferase [Deltaproteobacteria bacterium]|nr:methionyl-tRNA formyltransferase [Deltaproteobacteria bacterium]